MTEAVGQICFKRGFMSELMRSVLGGIVTAAKREANCLFLLSFICCYWGGRRMDTFVVVLRTVLAPGLVVVFSHFSCTWSHLVAYTEVCTFCCVTGDHK